MPAEAEALIALLPELASRADLILLTRVALESLCKRYRVSAVLEHAGDSLCIGDGVQTRERGAHLSQDGAELWLAPPAQALPEAERLLRAFASAVRTQDAAMRADLARRVSEQLESERVSGVASMVAGLAHDVNTPLGVAITSASTLGRLIDQLIEQVPDRPELAELRDDVKTATRLLTRNVERAADLVSSFKKFTAGQLAVRREIADLREIVDDCIASLSPESRRKHLAVEVKVDPPDADLRWDGYPGALAQVVVNLIQNAQRYAYPEGEGGKLEVVIVARAENFELSFADAGKGVEPTILPKIFEPYVTSSPGQGGTGLGLFIARTIMGQLGGSIACDSKPGCGTRFLLTLPAHRAGD